MRHLCCNKLLFILLFTFSLLFAKEPRVGFYYGCDISAPFIESFDWVVVDADQIDPIWAKRYGRKLFAYVSVGEYETWRHSKKPNPAWKLAENKNWNSTVMDLSNPDYQAFLLKEMQKLHKMGYKNFFLDTLDAVFAAVKEDADRKKEQKALQTLLQKIRTLFPQSKLIANRGVEVMDTLCQNVDAFAIESLYQGIDAKTKEYTTVSPKDREWITAQLNRAKSCGLLPVVIDYLPENAAKKRRETAQKIAAQGYVPYITDKFLKHYGEGKDPLQKREVLLLYDSSTLKDGDKVYANVHLMSSMPLEYLGYIPVLKDIKQNLPHAGKERYAGVVIWSGSDIAPQKRFFNWITKLLKEGQKLIFINAFGFEMDAQKAKQLGFTYQKAKPAKTLFARITYQSETAKSEIPPLVNIPGYLLHAKNAKEVILRATTKNSESFDAAAIMPWGGYADLQSALRDIDTEPMWAIDPFAFFKKALQTPQRPVPDPTTENGRRILFIHIDGDGFIEKARFNPKKYASEILLKEILQKYPLPHSISVIEGEIGEKGLHPELASKMEKIARKIFAKPFVEIASHSYSHPFKWQKLEESKESSEKEGHAYHLPIPGYHFDLQREIEGSVRFINKKLAPKGKKCKLFFWTGDCLPREDALRMTEEENLLAINGGDTTATKSNPWLGRIAPFGLQRGAFWQIYVGEQNENIYTNDWLGPYWGYRKVLETFNITQNPRRLKPINIYYHFYSASRIASLDALKRVYNWAIKQENIPLYTSEYILTAHDFYNTSIVQTTDGYEIRNRGNLRTLRIPQNLYPDFSRTKGIVGFRDVGKVRYVHLDGSGSYHLPLTEKKPKSPYLIESNGRVTAFDQNPKHYTIQLQAHLPLKAKFYLPKGWKSVQRNANTSQKGNILYLHTDAEKTAEISFVRR